MSLEFVLSPQSLNKDKNQIKSSEHINFYQSIKLKNQDSLSTVSGSQISLESPTLVSNRNFSFEEGEDKWKFQVRKLPLSETETVQTLFLKSENLGFQKLEHYSIGEMIGEGNFGEVFRATYAPQAMEVALKVIRICNFDEDYQQQIRFFLKSEVEVCNKIRESNHTGFLPKIYGVFEQDDCFYFAMELLHGFTLEQLLANEMFHLNSQEIQFYLASLLLALHEMHTNLSCIHRDIKPANIFILFDGSLRLLDFGCAKFMPEDHKSESIIGTYEYFSPQRFSEKYSFEADIWALTVVAHEMALKKMPFSFKNMNEFEEYEKFATLSKIVKRKKKFEISSDEVIDNKLKMLIQNVFNSTKQQRLTQWNIEFLKSQRFFQGFEWEELSQQKLSPPIKFSETDIEKIKRNEFHR